MFEKYAKLSGQRAKKSILSVKMSLQGLVPEKGFD